MLPERIDAELLLFLGGTCTGIVFAIAVLAVLLLIFGD